MKRRDFIKAMAAAAACPAFIADDIAADDSLPSVLLQTGDEPPAEFLYGVSWWSESEHSYAPLFPSLVTHGNAVRVDVEAGEVNTINVFMGDLLIFQCLVQGHVQMVYLHRDPMGVL